MMTLSSTTRSGLQIAGLWSLAVAQPCTPFLQRNPEFFVAYRAKLPELLALVAIISLAVPLVLWAIRWLLGRAWPTAGTGLQVTIIAVCAAAVASHALAITLALPTPLHVAAVILVGLTAAWAYVEFAGARWCATALAVTVPIAPIVFLGGTADAPVRAALRPDGRRSRSDQRPAAANRARHLRSASARVTDAG